jgi:hypothetical protein
LRVTLRLAVDLDSLDLVWLVAGVFVILWFFRILGRVERALEGIKKKIGAVTRREAGGEIARR